MTDLPRGQRAPVPDRGLLVSSAVALVGFAVILLTVVLTSGSDALDLAGVSGVDSLRGASVSAVATVVTGLGSFAVLLTVTVAAIVGLLVQTRQVWAPAILAGSVVGTASLVTLVKIAVGRARPSSAAVIGSPARDFSFPSGHTTNATLVYILAALLLTAHWRHPLRRRMVTASAVALALLIGLTRVYLGYHWATDVLAGWLLSTGVIAASCFTVRRLGPADDHDASVDTVLPLPHHRIRPHHLV